MKSESEASPERAVLRLSEELNESYIDGLSEYQSGSERCSEE